MMKKRLTVVLILALALTLAACAKAGELAGEAIELVQQAGELVEQASEKPDGSGAQDGQSAETPAAPAQGAAAAAAAFENRVALSLDKTVFAREERIEVTMDFGDVDKDNAIIVIVSARTPHGEPAPAAEDCEEYRWIADFSEIPFFLWAPDSDGLFDVRLYASESGDELAAVTIAVGDAMLPEDGNSGGSGGSSGNSGAAPAGGAAQGGNHAQREMEDTIVSYFSGVSDLTALSLCGGREILYEPADDFFQTVDIWTIYDPAMGYDDLKASMHEQLTAAGLVHEENSLAGQEWSVPVGDKAMRIELRPFYEGDDYYLIYATPKPE